MNTAFILSFLTLLSMITFAIYFRRAQNKNTSTGKWVGGEISWPKAFWLAYAIGSWFVIPLIFLFNTKTSSAWLPALIFHGAVWWVRGLLELIMIYRWYNWSPIYGISHDIVHNVVVAALTAWGIAHLGWETISSSHYNLAILSYLVITSFALNAEAVFAALFIMTREKGAHKIYFASDSPVFCLINNLTLCVCLVVYGHLIIQTILLWD